MAETKSNPAVEKRVMVGIDESECSYYALIWVLENLKQSIADWPLFLFTALPPPSSYTSGAGTSLGLARSYFPVASNAGEINLYLIQSSYRECEQLLRSKCQVPRPCCEETVEMSGL
ncbi:unnamed protein product [Citrullus colocynthis]|uniref:UspA domain-containing protein n=1 Tax=Citrullus colocynthis TaxID=252529 RepID=A0ABP0Y8S3_9ROSI